MAAATFDFELEDTRVVDLWAGITPSTCTDLEPVPAGVCPDCGAQTRTASWGQGALFWLYGHGAVEARTVRSCPDCGWRLITAHTTTNPRRDT